MSTRKTQRPPQKISTMPLFLFFGLVALLGASMTVIGRINKKKTEDVERQIEAEAAKVPVDPFADLPEEVGIGAGARGSRWATALSRDPNPTGLEAEDLWQRALDKADEAWGLADRAKAAKKADDNAQYGEFARQAKVAFEAAFSMTAEWEEQIVRDKGDRDPQVRRIMNTRGEWSEQARVFSKLAGR